MNCLLFAAPGGTPRPAAHRARRHTAPGGTPRPAAHRARRHTAPALASLTVLILAALLTTATPPTQAQTIISGIYQNNPTPPGNTDGYDATGGSSYVVKSTAIFRNNGDNGLGVFNASVTINGAYADGSTPSDFYENGVAGLELSGNFTGYGPGPYDGPVSAVINSGGFENNDFGVESDNATATINGGLFENNNGDGLFATSSAITINQGSFTNNSEYGIFVGQD